MGMMLIDAPLIRSELNCFDPEPNHASPLGPEAIGNEGSRAARADGGALRAALGRCMS